MSRVELLDEVQVRAINIANGKSLPETPTLMFEFIGTGEIGPLLFQSWLSCIVFIYFWLNIFLKGEHFYNWAAPGIKKLFRFSLSRYMTKSWNLQMIWHTVNIKEESGSSCSSLYRHWKKQLIMLVGKGLLLPLGSTGDSLIGPGCASFLGKKYGEGKWKKSETRENMSV